MRKLMQILVVAGFVLGIASQASALATIRTLVNGASSTSPAPGPGAVTVDIILEAGATGITGYSVTLPYNPAVLSNPVVTPSPAPGFALDLGFSLVPGAVESIGGAAFVLPGIAPGGSQAIASIVFDYAGGVDFLQADVLVAFVDGLTDGGVLIPTQAIGGTVPEPTTAALFALGLCGVAWSGRRREA